MKRYTIYMALGAGVLLSAFALAERQAFTKKIERRAGGIPSYCYDCKDAGSQCFSGGPFYLIGFPQCVPPSSAANQIPIIASKGTTDSSKRSTGAGVKCPDISNSAGNVTYECGTAWTCSIGADDRDCDPPTSME